MSAWLVSAAVVAWLLTGLLMIRAFNKWGALDWRRDDADSLKLLAVAAAWPVLILIPLLVLFDRAVCWIAGVKP